MIDIGIDAVVVIIVIDVTIVITVIGDGKFLYIRNKLERFFDGISIFRTNFDETYSAEKNSK